MDTRTGQIATIEEFRESFRQPGKSDADVEAEIKEHVVPIDKQPSATCHRCAGTGRVRRPNSRKFKPCRCTKAAD